jgi:hypothetical protein
MLPLRGFLLSWVLPKDRETLYDWLALIEGSSVLISLFFVLSLALSLVQTELVSMIRYAIFSFVSLVFLSFLTVMQYLMAIEFNTRVEKGKK